MFAKTTMAALAGTALLATVASAQTPTATTDRTNAAASDTMSSSQLQGEWRASKVVGLSVYNDNNEKLGSINDLLMDKSGNIKAVVLGVGGFLGMGEHLVAVPLDKVKFSSEPIVYTGTASTGTPSSGGSMMKPPGTPPPTSTTTGSAGAGGAAATKSNPWYPDHAVFNATKDELKAMPEFKYSNS
ncbi:MAG TPA: PRC-barrel domain-containing protein [Bradyrhizobium sp.]|jgi:sporulation protein YlmC with PRC-barrel domain|nr:PRC-barrel domain-containing protein [Bradyrhizobium sp.]